MNRKILLTVLFFSFLFLIANYAYACVLPSRTVYQSTSSPILCDGPTTTARDFEVDLFNSGCVCAVSVCCWWEQYYESGAPFCSGPEAKWQTCGTGSEGDICKIKSGMWCEDCFPDPACGGNPNGYWDTDDPGYGAQCVECSNRLQVRGRVCGGGDYWLPNTCEQACGAHPDCDEVIPGAGGICFSPSGCINNKCEKICYSSCDPLNDGCEAGCGADSLCDERYPKDPCGDGGTCNSNCQCIEPICTCDKEGAACSQTSNYCTTPSDLVCDLNTNRCVKCYNEHKQSTSGTSWNLCEDADTGTRLSSGTRGSLCTSEYDCDERAPYSSLGTCNKYGQSYFSDSCTAFCGKTDDTSTCRSSAYASGCTADSACNGVAPNGNCIVGQWCGSLGQSCQSGMKCGNDCKCVPTICVCPSEGAACSQTSNYCTTPSDLVCDLDTNRCVKCYNEHKQSTSGTSWNLCEDADTGTRLGSGDRGSMCTAETICDEIAPYTCFRGGPGNVFEVCCGAFCDYTWSCEANYGAAAACDEKQPGEICNAATGQTCQNDCTCPSVSCPSYTTQSSCNAASGCAWCTGNNQCYNAPLSCQPGSCNGPSQYCSNTCTWASCSGTDTCIGGTCQSGCGEVTYDLGCGAYCNWAGQCTPNERCLVIDADTCDVSPPGYYCINDGSCGAVCTPNGCNGDCPSGCTVSQDPDCGCSNSNGCCGLGCTSSNDNDCSVSTWCGDGSCNGGENQNTCCQDCGCPSGYYCDSGTCRLSCVPATCGSLGKNCGSWWDGCTQNLNCGSCGSGELCQNGVCTYCNACESCATCGGGSDCKSNEGSCVFESGTCDESGRYTFTSWSCYDRNGDGCKDCVSDSAEDSCIRVTDNLYCSLCERCNTNGACAVLMPDDPNCGTIDCSGWYTQTGTEGVTSTEYCYNKADIGPPSRCEAADSNSCKDPNTADCAPQANDAVQYTCDTCKYISSSSCTGTTLGGCTNYPSTTVCDQKDCDYLDACHGVTWYEYDDCTFYCDSGSCPNCQCGGETSVCDCHLQTPDCSQAGNWDGDSIACNCNCDDYDIEETVTNGNTCGDGKDNDCDGLIDTREPDCPETSMNFTGTLTYSTGLPVKNSLIEVVIRNTALGFEKKGHNLSDGNGVFFVRLQSLSYQMMTSDFDLAIYVAGEIEAIYECHYSSATDQCR